MAEHQCTKRANQEASREGEQGEGVSGRLWKWSEGLRADDGGERSVKMAGSATPPRATLPRATVSMWSLQVIEKD
jgi:hypothetical protein